MTVSTPSPTPERGLQSVADYIAMQPRLRWRRQIMRTGIRLVVMRLLCEVTVTGAENIPDSGGGILMMNHISLLDPILCMGAVRNRFVIPMTKVENLRSPVFGPFVRWYGAFSVNRGEVDRRALLNSIELIKNGQLILIAPEGTRQQHGLVEAKDGLAYVATKGDAIIIPAAISGAIGWQNELKRLRRPKINVNFGRPFHFRAEGRVPREILAAMSHEAMYQLALAVTDTSIRGAYTDVSKATTKHLEFI